MRRYVPIALAAMICCFAQASAWAGGCYNLGNGEPSELTGTLEYVMFPGPPNYEDVQTGDTPEPSYVLKLHDPICLSGDEAADPSKYFQYVQLVSGQDMDEQFRHLLHQDVTVHLTDAMAAITGHHHEPLVATVTSVSIAQAKPMEFTDEYGTAATTIQAFYDALGAAQGTVASAMVIPEKRSTPAFSPSNLTRFYGGLADPIRVVSIAQENDSTFIVNYHYATKSHACNGRATVTTTVRGGRNFIQSIHALNGC
ncbi:hypothetical protein K6L44_04050 [Gluconacetobacter entanii]|uniref:DUF4431 domain-containing protein n=2 Tax=Gluconacetobacter entanii TaxID=108528 RepID=A0ABT3K225_9PROT|nr:hypothetical protein [Gluconacetobacter entanii]MBY4639189.1 hypothetical protein [Gluconacetobacter entanii]MCW4589460.1 hypothetical protein [Gluconacetobacter entanii]MCW4593160.1 hypothetical protein [Gluconacetobacter entanii]NPC90301.1 hypothetical protein [Gluconacetobacter entanii]